MQPPPQSPGVTVGPTPEALPSARAGLIVAVPAQVSRGPAAGLCPEAVGLQASGLENLEQVTDRVTSADVLTSQAPQPSELYFQVGCHHPGRSSPRGCALRRLYAGGVTWVPVRLCLGQHRLRLSPEAVLSSLLSPKTLFPAGVSPAVTHLHQVVREPEHLPTAGGLGGRFPDCAV